MQANRFCRNNQIFHDKANSTYLCSLAPSSARSRHVDQIYTLCTDAYLCLSLFSSASIILCCFSADCCYRFHSLSCYISASSSIFGVCIYWVTYHWEQRFYYLYTNNYLFINMAVLLLNCN